MSDIARDHAELVFRLAKGGGEILSDMTPEDAHLLHMAVGICTEAGELLDAVKKATIYRKPIDIENIREEIGDLLFYLQGLESGLFLDRDTTLKANIEKLGKRYGNGSYSDEQAIARADKAA